VYQNRTKDPGLVVDEDVPLGRQPSLHLGQVLFLVWANTKTGPSTASANPARAILAGW